eukprot:c3494_g1_i1.p1 GENE.c3494_g1_i1~~c3494_g1_i1.p1  ORF type:complete len:225 (+),score=43.04 c3494_g1_i1:32-676(+)
MSGKKKGDSKSEGALEGSKLLSELLDCVSKPNTNCGKQVDKYLAFQSRMVQSAAGETVKVNPKTKGTVCLRLFDMMVYCVNHAGVSGCSREIKAFLACQDKVLVHLVKQNPAAAEQLQTKTPENKDATKDNPTQSQKKFWEFRFETSNKKTRTTVDIRAEVPPWMNNIKNVLKQTSVAYRAPVVRNGWEKVTTSIGTTRDLMHNAINFMKKKLS